MQDRAETAGRAPQPLLGHLRPEAAAAPESGIVEVMKYGRGREGLIPLWAGEGDLATPPFIVEAATRSLVAGETFYTLQRGIPELREALARYHAKIFGRGFVPEEFFITGSGMQAIQIALAMTVGAGQEIVIPTPTWPNAAAATGVLGAKPVEVPLTFGNAGWTLDLERVAEAIGPRARALFLVSPSNPTGWTASIDELRIIVSLARRHGLWIIADETYGRFWYGGGDRAPSFLDVIEPEDRVLFVNTFSKNWAMTGWRIGWIILPQGLTDQMDRLIEFNTSGGQSFLQHGCIAAIREGEPWVKWMVERCKRGRDLVLGRLNSMNRVSVIPADASFYLVLKVEEMGDPVEFCKRLVREARIGLAPGTAFGAGGEQYLRLCYAQGEDRLGEAMDRLQAFLGKA
jgi:aspartate/methionine/tyrosine aminotransferase